VSESAQIIVSEDPDNDLTASTTDSGAFYIDGDSDDTNELQDLQISGTILNLTNPSTTGNQIDLDVIFATDAELEALSINDDDADPTNEIQEIATDGTAGNISIENGNTIALNIEDDDADPTNEIQEIATDGTA